MANNNAQMAEFATNLWENFIKQKHYEASADVLTFYRAKVVSNDGGNRLTIQKPFEDAYQVSCIDGMNTATAGTQVIVIRYGNGTNNANHIVVAKGDGSPITGGGGGTDHGIPSGGTAGQALTKVSSTDYDVTWSNISSSPHGTYIHEQGTADSVWTITHNLNCYPAVTVIDSSNDVVVGEVRYISANQVELTFAGAFKGKAYLN